MKSEFKVNIDGKLADFNMLTFSGGEEHVKLSTNHVGYHAEIKAYIRDSAGIMQLALIKDALDGINCDKIPVSLVLPYVPYARQDRRCEPGEAFSLKVFARILNGMGFDSVFISDAHSDVAPALIENCVNITQSALFTYSPVFASGFHSDDTLLCSPDGGALKKIHSISKIFNKDVIDATKVRCTKTGQILETRVHCDSLEGKNVWIIDDIVDGGRTFTELAKVLKQKGAEQVNLWVTHGIFANGKQYLYDNGVDNVYAKYDWTNEGGVL